MTALQWAGEADASPYPLAFANRETYFLGSYPQSAAIGDVTGDGRNDVLVSTTNQFGHGNDYKLFLFRQQIDGTLAPPEPFAPLAVGSLQIAVGDLDQDGLNDVALTTGVGVNIFYQRNGTLDPPVAVPGTQGSKVDLADVIADGRNDLVVGDEGALRLVKNEGGGAFTVSTVGAPPGGEIEVGDLTGDGLLDIAGISTVTLRVFPQEVGGTFGSPANYTISPANALEIADLTGDDKVDVAVATGGTPPSVQSLSSERRWNTRSSRGLDDGS